MKWRVLGKDHKRKEDNHLNKLGRSWGGDEVRCLLVGELLGKELHPMQLKQKWVSMSLWK